MPGVPAAGAVAAARHSPTTLQTAPAHATKPEAFKAPVIDGRGFLARNRNEELPPLEVAEAIAEAGKAYGSFQLINHGVEQKLIERMQSAMKHFFALPKEDKLKVKRSKDNPLGYLDDEFTKQILDIKECFDFAPVYDPSRPSIPGLHTPNRWPEGEEEFKAALTAYVDEASRIAFKLMEAFSLGLGLPAQALHPAFGSLDKPEHTTLMRLNCYPGFSAEGQALALNEHTDPGFLTILLQDPEVQGLEVEVDGVWHPVPPIEGAYTINFGDVAQILSNDVYRAANHRVRLQGTKTRYSAPVFLNPKVDAVLEPLPDFVTADRPAAYRPVPWTEFMGRRVAGNLENLGEEVQTTHYRIR